MSILVQRFSPSSDIHILLKWFRFDHSFILSSFDGTWSIDKFHICRIWPFHSHSHVVARHHLRIANTAANRATSYVPHTKFETDFDLSRGSYSISNAANAAGFYNDAEFETLSSSNPTWTVAHAAPGSVNTSWGTEMPWYLRGLVRMVQPLGRDLETCGEILTKALLEIKEPGYHRIDQNGKTVTDKKLYTNEERESIWKKTLDLLPKF